VSRPQLTPSLARPIAVAAWGAIRWEGPLSSTNAFNALDADGDGLVTEAELRAAAEYRGIQLTEEQVSAFLAADADGDGVDVDEYIASLDTTVLGVKRKWPWVEKGISEEEWRRVYDPQNLFPIVQW